MDLDSILTNLIAGKNSLQPSRAKNNCWGITPQFDEPWTWIWWLLRLRIVRYTRVSLGLPNNLPPAAGSKGFAYSGLDRWR